MDIKREFDKNLDYCLNRYPIVIQVNDVRKVGNKFGSFQLFDIAELALKRLRSESKRQLVWAIFQVVHGQIESVGDFQFKIKHLKESPVLLKKLFNAYYDNTEFDPNT